MDRVLWICNIMLPAIGQALHLPYSNREGWLSGIFERVQRRQAPFALGICFPLEAGTLEKIGGKEITRGARELSLEGTLCYAFAENMNTPEIYESGMEKAFREIFCRFRPDMIHIFGTEFPHTLAAVRSFGRPERTLIGIQGLCSEIARVYMAGLPRRVQKAVTFRDFVRADSIRQQQEKFVRRGEYEAEALRSCANITGRTRFDREGTARINPQARYFAMNETMRQTFYEGEWKLSGCEEHSIFLGQGDYPLKGMHFVLQAMALLAPEYPDMKLYVAGNSVIARKTLGQRLKLPAYGKYLLSLIRENALTDQVIMMGKLDGPGMRERFLKSSVFVCASVLENSPNTVGEAQLLGVPVAASRVGGIPDMITDGEDGLLFPAGDAAGLAQALQALWDRSRDAQGLCLAQRISGKAARRARQTFDGEKNYHRLLEIYGEIMK